MKHLLSLLFAFHLSLFTSAKPTSLTAPQAAEALARVITQWKDSLRPVLRLNERNHTITNGQDTLRYWYHGYGQEPADGRSLYISMHGGAGAPKAVNDQQWENQKQLYRPAEGVYLTPRAPWDAWNMWFQEPIDAMFEELIRTMVVLYNVNPDKVYLMGYSAGGDGVWRLAPRLADHWAAASMMAGHPGDVSLLNVRNLPFTIWCGALDAAYNRNKEVAMRGLQLDSLQQADPTGYRHECHIVEGKPHWMDLVDAAAVPWMAQYRRNPYPRHVVWQQEEVLRSAFYWLQAPADELQRGRKVIATIEGNTITLQHCDYTHLTLCLNDQLVDLDKPVQVICQGRRLFKGRLQRSEHTLRQTLTERGDPRYAFPTRIDCKVK